MLREWITPAFCTIREMLKRRSLLPHPKGEGYVIAASSYWLWTAQKCCSILIMSMFLYFVCLSATKSCAHFPSETVDGRDLKLCISFIIISRCAYCQDRRIQSFFFELWWIQERWGCKIAYCSLLLLNDLKLCGMLHCHLEVCILSGQEDPIIFLWVMVDPRGVVGVKRLYSLFLIDSGVATLNFLNNVISMWRCVYCRDGRVQLWVMVDPRGVEGVKYLVHIFFLRWRDLKLCWIIYCHL
jgi:hypothetical protein